MNVWPAQFPRKRTGAAAVEVVTFDVTNVKRYYEEP
jgi:hypothetical protein